MGPASAKTCAQPSLYFVQLWLAKPELCALSSALLPGRYNLPIPPLREKKSIVSTIEELLSDLENGKQQLRNAQQQLKVYRHSLLKRAFEAKLVNYS